MPRCKTNNCEKNAFFGVEFKKPVCCNDCRTIEMKDVVNPRCTTIGCEKRAAYNKRGNKKPIYCGIHKKPGMAHVSKQLCIGKDDTCETWASYNSPDSKKGLYCVICKLPGMVDVTSKKCVAKGCISRPFYNLPGMKAKYCAEHMNRETMVNVSNRRCLECDQYPAFNLPGKIAIYCAQHRKTGMINVICKYCIEEGCTKVPSFNLSGEKALYCRYHKKDDMIDVKTKRCMEEGCTIQPQYNYPGINKRIYCYTHKKDGMVHTGYPQCISDLCIGYGHEKYRGRCLQCFVHMFPNETIARNYKVKERHVADFIGKEFIGYTIKYDAQTGGCSRRRPDFMFDCIKHIIIIECDENQHKNYDATCEEQRNHELFTDLGDRPIVFIRFNPDGYKDNTGQKQKSSFDYTKTPVPIIRDHSEWNCRLSVLKTTVQSALNTIPSKPISSISLFYDGY